MSAGYTWIKLYTEIVDDPKMERLPDHLWRLAIELFLLAGKENGEGELPSLEDMAWVLHKQEGELEQNLRALSKVIGLHYDQSKGLWVLENFSDRQAALTSTERSRKARKSNPADNTNEHATKTLQSCNENVAQGALHVCNENVAEEEEEGEKDEEEEKEGEKDEEKTSSSFSFDPVLSAIYRQHFEGDKPFGHKAISEMQMLVDDYSAEWLRLAMGAAVKARVPKLDYVGAILRRWDARGGPDVAPKAKARPATMGKRPEAAADDVKAMMDQFLRGGKPARA